MSKRICTMMMTLLLAVVTTTASALPAGDAWNRTIAEAIANTGGGDGSSENAPIRIASAAELAYLAQQAKAGGTVLQLTNEGPLHAGNETNFEGTFFKLADNITLDSWTTSIGTFAGTFDGQGHAITLTGTASLFATIKKGGTVKNLGVNATISAVDEKAGGIAATNKGTIQRCYVEGSITSTNGYSSGIADNQGTTENKVTTESIIEDCYTTVSVTITGTGYYAGGIAGGNYNGTIRRCYATGAISSQGSAGIAGAGISTNSIQNCIALNESITGTGSNRARVANGSGTLSDNYASPAIPGTWKNIGADKKDGADLTAANFIGTGAGKGAFTAWSGDIWDFGNNANLPTLKGFKTDQPVKDITRKSVIPAITTIATAEDLATFRDAMNKDGETYKGKTVTLAADITVRDWDTPISDDDYKKGIFKGTFDGQGHVITLTGSASLFGQIGESTDKVGTVQNLGVNTTIDNEYSNAAGIVNANYGTILHCYTAGTINAENAENAGGIAMFNYNLIRDCYTTATVTGKMDVGGIASKNSGTIQRCYATGAVKGYVINGEAAGGIAGKNSPKGSKVESCIALNTSIEGPNGGLGRIVGFNNSGTLTGNYASPLIDGTWNKIGADEQDGADLTDDNFIDTGAGASAFDGWQTAVWDFSNADNLPTLKGFKGDQPVKGITRASVMSESLITTIATAADLAAFRDAVNSGKTYEGKTVTLTADITLAGDWTPISTSDNQFNGTFEGGGHCISGLSVTISEGGDQYGGLFNTIGEKGIVQDLGVKGTVSVTSKDASAFAGGITGYNYGTIQHCYTNVTVTASTGNTQSSSDHAGGIAGINSNLISCCYTMGNSTAILNAGGIAGTNEETIEQCYATGAVKATNTSAGSAGGIVGNSFNGSSNIMCIALNSSITGGSSSGRIYGNGNGSFDYNYASPAIAGTWKNTGADKQDGADLTAANFIGKGAEEGAFNGWFPDVWDFSDANKLPKLKTTGLPTNIVIAGQDILPDRADFLEKVIEIATAVTYDAATHGGKDLVVAPTGTLIVNVADASIRSLDIEEGGQVNTTQPLAITNKLTTARTLAKKWITFGSPLALTPKYTVSPASMYTRTGYSEAGHQSWNTITIPTPLTANTPYLLAADHAETALTLTATGTADSPVTIPAFEAAEGNELPNTGIFLFRMNPSLCNQTLKNIYTLSEDGAYFKLQEDDYVVKPFECYLIADAATRAAVQSLRAGSDLPTGNTPVLPSDAFRLWGANGQLHLDATTPAEVAIYTLSGRLLHRFRLDGSRTLTLGQGIYLVRSNNITYKVSL